MLRPAKAAQETLILCASQEQCEEVWGAFGIAGRYEVVGCLIPGSRFEKIIMFCDRSEPRCANYVEHIKGWLFPNGKLWVIHFNTDAIPEEKMLTRVQVSEALHAKGYSVAYGTLATQACTGGGPPFTKFDRTPMYRWGDVLRWVESKCH